MSRLEEAKECLADEWVESLWASFKSLRYSSPPLLNGNGVTLSIGVGHTTHDSEKLKSKLLLFVNKLTFCKYIGTYLL